VFSCVRLCLLSLCLRLVSLFDGLLARFFIALYELFLFLHLFWFVLVFVAVVVDINVGLFFACMSCV
jgi:hypothetical protein